MPLASLRTYAKPMATRYRACRRFGGGTAFALVLLATPLFAFGGGQARAQTPQPGGQSAPAAGGIAASCVVAPRPNSLWSLAQCCARDLKSDPGCRYYSKADEFVILKDNSRVKPDSYMIIPTAKITGIEDKQIFAPPFVDFWAYGWQQAKTYMKRPAADTALAINSTTGRTQNQLHIHISCVRPDVAQTLAANEAKIGPDPATALRLTLGPDNHTYRVIKVSGLSAADSPYNLVAAMPEAQADMAAQSIAVVGSTTPGWYYVLDTYVHGANPGAAEELLDQFCRR